MDCGDAGGEPAFSAEKTRSRSQRKETGREENYGHTCSFLNNYIEVWLLFSVALSSPAQQCDSALHIKIYFFLILFHVVYH